MFIVSHAGQRSKINLCWQLFCLFLEHFKGSTELLRSAHSVVNNEWAVSTGLGDQHDCV
jgi:hypothetical protein